MTLALIGPLVVLVVALVGLVVLGGRAADEAVQLRNELRRLGQLRPLLAEVSDGSARLQATLARLQSRRP